MSFRKFVAGVSFLSIAAMAARVTIDADTFWHLAAGRWIWQHGQLLRLDPFSVTRLGQPWVYPGWLAQILLFLTHDAFNYLGLNLYTLISVLLSFILLWMAMSEAPLVRGFVLILAAASSAIFWSARPQMLTLLLTVVFLIVLEAERKKGPNWKLWILPPLMTLWVNLHGGYIAGFLAILAYFGARLIEFGLIWLLDAKSLAKAWQDFRQSLLRLILLLGLCLVAVAINPFGAQMISYPFKTISLETLANYIQEWQSPNFHQPNTWPFGAMLLASGVSFGLSRRKVRAHEVLLFVGFGALALHAARNIALFAVAVSLPLARHLESALKPLADRIGRGRQVPQSVANRLNMVAFFLLILTLVIWGLPRLSTSASQSFIEEQFPVEAVDRLQTETNPVVFHTYRWGGYIIWQGWPNLKSFVDGRTDLFGDELLEDYLTIYRAEPGYRELLERWAIEWILVEPSAPLAAAAGRAGWTSQLRQSGSVLLQIDQ